MRRAAFVVWLTISLVGSGRSVGVSTRTNTRQTEVDGSAQEESEAVVANDDLGVPLATSSERDELDHDGRSDLYDVVADVPGIHLRRAAERANVSPSTARYHVRVLERADLLESETKWGKRRLYPAGLPTTRHSVVAATNDPTLGPVIAAVAATDPATVNALADELDRAPSTVSHHLDQLANDGLVERERDGECVLTQLSTDVTNAVR
jgi:predicted transcriptional regulator